MHKFMFDTDFDAPVVPLRPVEVLADLVPDVEPEPVEPPAPTFSEEELAAAREEAYAIGRDDGMKETTQADEHRIAVAVETLSKGFGSLSAAQEKANETTTRLAVALAVTMTRRLLPEAARLHGVEEVAAVVSKVMPHILEQPRVFVRVPPDLVDPLRSGLTEIAEANGYEGRLLLVADENMGPADCRIEWADGGAERDMARMWRGIEESIVNNGGEMPPENEPLRQISEEETSSEAGGGAYTDMDAGFEGAGFKDGGAELSAPGMG